VFYHFNGAIALLARRYDLADHWRRTGRGRADAWANASADAWANARDYRYRAVT
jgi:hypothetical protein